MSMSFLQKLKPVFTPLRYLFTAALLTYLVWRADPALIWQKWSEVNLPLVVLAMVLQLLGIALSSAKWWLLLRARNQQQPYPWLLRSYLVGQFANNFLPTSVGGDAVRIVQLGRRMKTYSQASASVFVDRLTGFLALSLIANIALVVTYSGMAGFELTASNPADHQFLNDQILFLVTIGFTLAGVAAAIGCLGAPWVLQRVGRRLPEVVRSPMERIAHAVAAYFPRGSSLLLVLGMSFAFQSLWVLINYVCGQALGIEAPLLIYALIAPIADILGLLPIFVNNIGPRELVFTFFLFYVGVPKATALALAFLILTVRLVVSSLGGLVMLSGGSEMRMSGLASREPPGSESPDPSVKQTV